MKKFKIAFLAAAFLPLSSCATMSAKDGTTHNRIDRDKLSAALDLLDYLIRPEGVQSTRSK